MGSELSLNSTILISEPNEAVDFSSTYQIVATLLLIIVFLTGLLGNLLVIVVVIRSEEMRTITNFYLVSLACSDVLILLSCTLPAIFDSFFYRGQFFLGPVFCAIFIFLQYLGINTSALCITAFTVERYIGICHPIRAQSLCTHHRAKLVILSLWVFGVLYHSSWLYLATTFPYRLVDENLTIQTCTYRVERDEYAYIYMVDLVLFYILPLAVTCTLYTLIARTLCHSARGLKMSLTSPNLQEKPETQHLKKDKLEIRCTVHKGVGVEAAKRVQAARLQVKY